MGSFGPKQTVPLANLFPPLPASENSPATPSLSCFIVVFFRRLLKIIFVPAKASACPPPRCWQAQRHESLSSLPVPCPLPCPQDGLQRLLSIGPRCGFAALAFLQTCLGRHPLWPQAWLFPGRSDAEAPPLSEAHPSLWNAALFRSCCLCLSSSPRPLLCFLRRLPDGFRWPAGTART